MKNFFNFKSNLGLILILSLILFSTQSCDLFEEEEEDPIAQLEPIQETSIIPATFFDRPVQDVGTINVTSKAVTFEVWDSQTVDGDIVTLIVNGRVILSEYSLEADKTSISVNLDNKGYNYIMLYAHNEGSISPNTAALSVTDSSGNTQNLTLSANLSSNSAYNIVVN